MEQRNDKWASQISSSWTSAINSETTYVLMNPEFFTKFVVLELVAGPHEQDRISQIRIWIHFTFAYFLPTYVIASFCHFI